MSQTEFVSQSIIGSVQFHPQGNPIFFVFLLILGVVITVLVFHGLQKISQRNVQISLLTGLLLISLVFSNFLNLAQILMILSSTIGSGFENAFVTLGMMYSISLLSALQWSLIIILPAFILPPSLMENVSWKDIGFCTIITIIFGIIIQILILFTPFFWISIFSFAQVPPGISKLIVQIVFLLITFFIASGSYYCIHELKLRVPLVNQWLAVE